MKKLQILLAAVLCANLVSCGGPIGKTGRESYKNQGEKIEDTKVIRAVKDNFRTNPLIPADLIHIAIDRGVVQLSGFVNNHEQANMAVLSVRGVNGVKDVINNLVILSGAEYSKIRANAERYSTAR